MTDYIKEFIYNANQIHDNKYDYSKIEYVNRQTEIIIICKTHGEFEQRPNYHLSGRGCYECETTNEPFITLSEEKNERNKYKNS